ncbi:hypothetical protein OGAPHI_002062 [Ogataea philodendri]|uniref:glycerol kinase n=1 Tax=Ogataea philodendri TaxID=1378263 RepID=A0A9P8P9Y7_9ASCO|nr:uncharacterized protein OGAPHI_002062 [Ogataea philodendri]KAH3668308.1 hypothetical protein OGAPHI_002062 [Ogataea philodendri]
MTSVPLICSIDIGTTSTRVILFTDSGEEVTKHQIEYSTSAKEGSKRNSPTIFSNEGIPLDIGEGGHVKVEEDHHAGPTLSFPEPGWVECDPCHILANVLECLGACLTQLEISNSEEPLDGSSPTVYHVAAIGIANMRETTIIWSKKTGRPLHNGIVWNDTRTLSLMNNLNANVPVSIRREIQERAGCPISTYFSALKWTWLYQNVPLIRNAYESGEGDLMFGTVDTWLIYNITREKSFMTDITNASRTSFMNLQTKNYDEQLLEFWGVDPNKMHLPEIVPSSHNFGTFELRDLKEIGYNRHVLSEDEANIVSKYLRNVPITGCLGDQSASLVGQLAFHKGDAKCTYGTGAFLLYNTGDTQLVSEHGAVTTVGYWFPELDESVDGPKCAEPHFCLEGSIAVAGSCVQWLRDNLKLIYSASHIGPLAAQAPTSAGVVFVPAFSGLFAPYWNAQTTGTIFGLTQYSKATHIARAAIEGVCFQVRAILNAMVSDASSSHEFLAKASQHHRENPLNTLHVDGGMSQSDVVMQIQADILGPSVSVVRSHNAECTALGSAIAAGLHKDVKIWESLEHVKKKLGGDTNGPNMYVAQLEDAKREKMWRLWERAISRARDWLEDDEDEDVEIT